ncbi:cobalt ABC transporter, inner membrane subunit CbiQ [Methanohalobium evestigatum Z-7303]|uniref:Cobalt ABC transporter, inner membrane subunit CbiQ n=1 Tax=Methanohalobium evestigatum (strain ATCC BAA-1072 / DSM 3721 / NBRC 107634 / OCM 161 / Z-7303) TaxID=644295 RepID=D7EA56_METEZ|nr:cobalt ECF transporter T component CbiQ [Methanohalobium evestigatum]ADI74727.1 cobalt ABC transporter, inner membrane subunit CbiQ [Methanohalobium evestigatum Z-7303]
MNYPRIDAYSEIESVIHNFDPRAKIITFTVLIFSFAFIESLTVAMFAVLFSVSLIFISKLPIEFVYARLKYPIIFIFAIFVIMCFTVEGNIIIDSYFVSVTLEGLKIGLLIFLRATAALIIAFLMLATNRFDTVIKALYMLKLPNAVVQMIVFSYRYIFVLVDEFQNMKKSMSAKGFEIKANRYGLSTIGNLIGMLLVKSYERGERVHKSMISKGYEGKPRMDTNYNLMFSDYVLTIFMMIFAFGVHIYPVI